MDELVEHCKRQPHEEVCRNASVHRVILQPLLDEDRADDDERAEDVETDARDGPNTFQRTAFHSPRHPQQEDDDADKHGGEREDQSARAHGEYRNDGHG